VARKDRVAPAQDKLAAIGIEAVCERIADCETLQSIADSAGVSKGTLITWLASFPDQYARAREAQADKLAEDILAIADDGSNDTYKTDDGEAVNHDVIARSRLRVDARKWLAGKMAPKKYGDKLAVGGADDLPPIRTATDLTDAQLAAIAAGKQLPKD
jgi:AcrR family transcriptional regulator